MRGRGRRGRCWSRPFGLLWRQPTGGTNSQGTARGERAIVLLGRFSTAQAGDHGQVYFPQGTKQEVNEPDKGAAKETIVNQTAKETVLEISAGRRNRTPIGWRSANDRNWLSFFDRSHQLQEQLLRVIKREIDPATATIKPGQLTADDRVIVTRQPPLMSVR